VGTHYTFDRLQQYFNPGPMHHPAPQIWTGGVNRGMCLLAGERSDGFVCHPTSSHPLLLRETILPALAEGAATVGRADGGPLVVANPQPIMAATADAVGEVRDARRSELGFLYSTPAYRRQLEVLGLEEVGPALTDMARRSDWTDLGRHLSDEMVTRLVPQGTYEEIPPILEDWYAGLCNGLVVAVPPDPQDDELVGLLVERCRDILSARPAN
jgi:alkanesulfonate monooxygenase SsuD/methylene tetrahydromethanopterin reductase-like flavin-dependent oxidoreductase (luciferase family)